MKLCALMSLLLWSGSGLALESSQAVYAVRFDKNINEIFKISHDEIDESINKGCSVYLETELVFDNNEHELYIAYLKNTASDPHRKFGFVTFKHDNNKYNQLNNVFKLDKVLSLECDYYVTINQENVSNSPLIHVTRFRWRCPNFLDLFKKLLF